MHQAYTVLSGSIDLSTVIPENVGQELLFWLPQTVCCELTKKSSTDGLLQAHNEIKVETTKK